MRELLEAIERVKERIQKHEARLRANEMLTRYALIDPILRALGWDTEDPEQVMPEHRTEVGRPDYVLQWQGQKIGVEAKHLATDERTFSEARRKALPLFQEEGIRYYLITDGDRWVLWDISRPKEQQPEPVFDLCLSRDNPGDTARQLLALWRPAMPEVVCAPKSVAELLPPLPERPKEGISLSELRQTDVTGQRVSGDLRFPDGRKVSINRWRDLLLETAKWALPKLELPVKGPRGQLLISRTDKDMRVPKPVDHASVETNFSAKDCIRLACHILEVAGVNPDDVVLIGWAPGERGRRRGARG